MPWRHLPPLAAFLALGCGSEKVDPFKPVPECKPSMVLITPLKSDRQVVLSSLQIAPFNEGFDLNLDKDKKVDNKLAPLGSLANSSIMQSFQFAHNIILPLDVWGYTGGDSDCTKFAFYLGRYVEDRDGDGRETTWESGKADCDDTNPMVRPKVMEDLMNRIDDDCDGYADNMSAGSPGMDTMDLDGDGVSPKDGDCDDRMAEPLAKLRHRGAKDVCGNGIDEDCDGIPDNDPTCDPFKDNKVGVHVQAISFLAADGGTSLPLDGGVPDGGLDVTGQRPLIVFDNGKVEKGVLTAGPNLFKLNLPFDRGIAIDLTLTGARVKATLQDKPNGTYLTGGLLGGVLGAASLAQIKGLNAGGVLKPEQSLLDAIFVGPVATILGLDSDDDGHYLPDIDVDGDGIETFWQENMMAGPDGGAPLAIVDTCKDGDGKIYRNGDDGKGTPCPLLKDEKGNFRFVDGLSVALKFNAVPVRILDVVPK